MLLTMWEVNPERIASSECPFCEWEEEPMGSAEDEAAVVVGCGEFERHVGRQCHEVWSCLTHEFGTFS